MALLKPAVSAIFKRDLRRWFGNPTGYVFITLFVLLCAAALFWPDRFFQSNLANLDTLNSWFPRLLLFFIPAITMSIWAGERNQGTDELLLTLPASDGQIVLGKFLAGAGIYTVALCFSLPVVIFLAYLGDPDWGLMVSNYLGFWFLGLTLIAAGMIGSQLSDNLTVAFIFGALFCLAVVLFEQVLAGVFPGFVRAWSGYGPIALFAEMGRGVVSLSALLLFAGLITALLYMNLLLLSRRHWRAGGGESLHLTLRFLAIVLATVSLSVLGGNAGARVDATVESVHSLSDETRRLIQDLDPERPVYVQAYVSPDVPREYNQVRRTLLNLLREYDALGGSAIQVRIVDTEPFTEEAREADTKFGIRSRKLGGQEGGRIRDFDVVLGIAFTCGLEEVVIPFLDRGLPVEYELTRSVRVVASAKRLRIGLLDTDVKFFGGMDFQRMSQDPEWAIVRELRLQYEVLRVNPEGPYEENLDALIVPMASSLTQMQMDILSAHILAGNPTLILDDPFPYSAPGNAPSDQKGGQQNPMMMGRQPPGEQKGNIQRLLEGIDIRWNPREVVWATYNPHPQYTFEREFVFIGKGSGGMQPFNTDEPATAALQEVITLFSGQVKEGSLDGIRFTPLLKSSPQSGTLPYSELVVRSFLGQTINPRRRYGLVDGTEKVLACHVRGKATEDATASVNTIFVADLDIVASLFFQIRAQGIQDFQFDNITFLLNCVDTLAGEESFISLRSRRPQHRTLSLIEERERDYTTKWLAEREQAEQRATDELSKARQRLNEKVDAIRSNPDLDARSKDIQIATVQSVEQRLLEEKERAIEDQKEQEINLAKVKRRKEENAIRNFYKLWALVLAPIPAVLLGIVTTVRRVNREREFTITPQRQGGA